MRAKALQESVISALGFFVAHGWIAVVIAAMAVLTHRQVYGSLCDLATGFT